MKKVQGIIFSNLQDDSSVDVAAHRSIASVPIGGRYRLIDFTLSNMANSGIEYIGIITKNNYQSLMDHVGNGREWDMSRKNGGLAFLPPYGRSSFTGSHVDIIDALMGAMSYIKAQNSKYSLITYADHILNINYDDVIEKHIESQGEITVIYKRMAISEKDYTNETILKLAPDGFAQDMLKDAYITGERNIYLKTIVIATDLLIKMVEDAYNRNKLSFVADVLLPAVSRHKVNAYKFDGYVKKIYSMKSYYEANMELLNKKVKDEVFFSERPIYTKVRDEAPVIYRDENTVINSLIADGCIIAGHVENSVLFRGLSIEKSACIKNSIIMQGSEIGAGATIEYAVIDKNVIVQPGKTIMGTEDHPIYIQKDSLV